MPKMGESIAEGTVVRWFKRIGEHVQRDEPLFEISTDKVDTEVPSPTDGCLQSILVQEGDTVPIHTVVCLLSAERRGVEESLTSTQAAPITAAGHARHARHAGQAGQAGQAGTSPEPRRSEGEQAIETPAAATASDLGHGANPGLGPCSTSEPPIDRGSPAATDRLTRQRLSERSSPLVRRLAAEEGIDLRSLRGSGEAGRVTRDDVERHLERRHGLRTPHSLSANGTLSDRQEPMSPMRRQIAEHMLQSRQIAAHVSTIFEVDMSSVEAARATLRGTYQQQYGLKLTYMPFLVQAVARSLEHFPVLNASVEGQTLQYHGSVHVGVAVALEDGLIVPVVRDANRKSLLSLAQEIADLALRARNKQLSPDEVRGGTFTITNPGSFGGLIGTPIINQPQSAILYVGAVHKRPIVPPGTDSIAVRSMAYLSLTVDHRIIDGAVADQFMSNVKATLGNW